LHRYGHRDRAGATARQLLDEEEAGGEVAVRAAPRGRVVQAEEPELPAAAEDGIREEADRLPFVDVGPHLGVHVPAHARAELLVLVAEDRMTAHRRILLSSWHSWTLSRSI